MREHWVRERTALMNHIRAILSEFGFIMPTGKATLMREVPLLLEDAENLLPHQARHISNEAYSTSSKFQPANRWY